MNPFGTRGKIVPFFLIGTLLYWGIQGWADILVAEGHPLLQGTVLGMDSNELRFQTSDGETLMIPRNQVVRFDISPTEPDSAPSSDDASVNNQLNTILQRLETLEAAIRIQYQAILSLQAQQPSLMGLTVVEQRDFVEGNKVILQGMVRNDSEQTQRGIAVTGYLLRGDTTLRQATVALQPNWLYPGNQGTFRIEFVNPPTFTDTRIFPGLNLQQSN